MTLPSNLVRNQSAGIKLAVVEPSTSRLVIYVDPHDMWSMRFLQAFGFREELLHGERQRFGLTKSVHLLKREARLALFSILRDEIDLQTGVDRIARNRRVCSAIREERESLLEAVDKFLIHAVTADTRYLEQQAEIHAQTHNASYDEVLERLQDAKEAIEEKQIREIAARSDIFESLKQVRQTYDLKTAESVADAALDIPYLIQPLEFDGYASVPHEALDLRSRFEAAIDALHEVDNDAEKLSPDTLLKRLRQRLLDPLESDSARDPGQADLPLDLIKMPLQSLETDSKGLEGYEAVEQSTTELGQIINSAFRSISSFGGIVYVMEDGGRPIAERTNWLVNPRIADEPTRTGLTYEELWQKAFLGEQLLEQIERATRLDGSPDAIQCPLCTVSPENECGKAGCACESYVDAVEDRLNEIVTALQDRSN